MITTTNFRLDFLTQNNNGIISSSSILGNFFCCHDLQKLLQIIADQQKQITELQNVLTKFIQKEVLK